MHETERNPEVTEDWRRLHNGQRHDLYPSQNICWVIKQREMINKRQKQNFTKIKTVINIKLLMLMKLCF